jgi:hypothetical protein
VTSQVSSAVSAQAFQGPFVRFAIAAVLALAASASAAQGVVTLYGGARAGGEFIDENAGDTVIKLDGGAAASLSFDWILSDGRQAQVFYSFQRSALPGSVLHQTGDILVNISYLHAGGRVFIEGTPATTGSYVVGGLGITHLSPGLDGLSSEVRPSMNLGLGYQWVLSKQIALRSELRGYLTLVNSSGGFFCSGGCVVSIRGDTMTQVEGMLGLSFGF